MIVPSFGIVIQGPLDSRGFDTRSLIEEYCAIVAAQTNIRIRLCVSTWKGQNIGALADIKNGVDILENQDPGKPDLHNRRRQIVSSANGAHLLIERYAPDYLIKVRSDQRLDLLAMCQHLIQLEQSGRLTDETIIAPGASREIAFFVMDFYFGGRAKSMIRFLERVREQSDSPIQHAAEIDIMLKYHCLFPGKTRELHPFTLRTQFYFCPWLAQSSARLAFDAAWREARERIRFFSREIYVKMEWRGQSNNIDFIPDPYFDGEEPESAGAPAVPVGSRFRDIVPLVRVVLFLYTLELLICGALGVKARNVFIKIAERYRARICSRLRPNDSA